MVVSFSLSGISPTSVEVHRLQTEDKVLRGASLKNLPRTFSHYSPSKKLSSPQSDHDDSQTSPPHLGNETNTNSLPVHHSNFYPLSTKLPRTSHNFAHTFYSQMPLSLNNAPMQQPNKRQRDTTSPMHTADAVDATEVTNMLISFRDQDQIDPHMVKFGPLSEEHNETEIRRIISSIVKDGFDVNIAEERDNGQSRREVVYIRCANATSASELRSHSFEGLNPLVQIPTLFRPNQCFLRAPDYFWDECGSDLQLMANILNANGIPVVSPPLYSRKEGFAVITLPDSDTLHRILVENEGKVILPHGVILKLAGPSKAADSLNYVKLAPIPFRRPRTDAIRKLVALWNVEFDRINIAPSGRFAILRVVNAADIPNLITRSVKLEKYRFPKVTFQDSDPVYFRIGFRPVSMLPGYMHGTSFTILILLLISSLRRRIKTRIAARVALLSLLLIMASSPYCCLLLRSRLNNKRNYRQNTLRRLLSKAFTSITKSSHLCKTIAVCAFWLFTRLATTIFLLLARISIACIHALWKIRKPLLVLLAFWYLPTATAATPLSDSTLKDYNLRTIASLIVITVNIRGQFRDSFDRENIKKFITQHTPDILVLQETWVQSSSFKSFPNIYKSFPGYHLHFADACPGRSDRARLIGGQILLIKDEWTKDYKLTVKNDSRIVELKWHIGPRSPDWIFWFVYAPTEDRPKRQFWNDTRKSITRAQLETGEAPFFLLGDLNVAPYPYWDRYNHENTDPNKPELKEFSNLQAEGLIDLWRHRHPNKRKWSLSKSVQKSWSYSYTCNSCDSPISGTAKHCLQCPDFDLCEDCFPSHQHNDSHMFSDINTSQHKGTTTELQQSRIDIALGNTIANRITAKSKILKPDSIAPDHCPILLQLDLPSERYVMNTPSSKMKSRYTLNKKEFANKNKAESFTKKLEGCFHSDDPLDSNIHIEADYFMHTLLDEAAEIFGQHDANRKRSFTENQNILGKETNIRRLRRILRAKKSRSLGARKLSRINKAIAFSGGVLPSFDYSEKWYNAAASLLNKEQKDLTTERAKVRKEFIRKSVDKLLNSQKLNPKSFYRAANADKLSMQHQITSVYENVENNTIRTNAPDKVREKVKSFWQNIFRKRDIDSLNIPWITNHRNTYPKNWAQHLGDNISKKELDDTIQAAANGKAGDIPAELLKLCGPAARSRLLNIFNQVLAQKQIPRSWKTARMCSIYKKGDPADLGNYRPITVAPQLYKIFMSIINARFRAAIEDNDILLAEQGGSRPARSTLDKAASLIGTLQRRKKKGKKLYVAFFDMQKCFDSIDHELVIETLRVMNIPKPLLDLFTSNYDEANSVLMDTAYGPTDPIEIQRGIRQGCPFSPTLLNLVLDPIMRDLKSRHPSTKIYAYVDDLAVICKSKEALTSFCEDLKSTWEFASLLLGEDKTGCSKTAILSDDETMRPIIIGINNPITIPIVPSDRSYKYLGVSIDPSLSWNPALTEIDRKLDSFLPYLRARCFTQKQSVDIINMILIPHITYRMAAIAGFNEKIQHWERRIAYTIGYKGRIINYECPTYLYPPRNLGGCGLRKLSDEIAIARLEATTTFGLWSKDINRSRQIAEDLKQIEDELRHEKLYLKPFMNLQRTDTYLTTGRISNDLQNVALAISKADDNSIRDNLAKALREQQINSHIIFRYLALGEIPAQKHNERARIFTDGSKNNLNTSYAIFCSGFDRYTFAGKLPTIDSIDRAELLAVLHALLVGMNFSESIIYTDSQYAVSAFNLASSDLTMRRKESNYDLKVIIREIYRRRANRSIYVHKVMAHCLDADDENERKRRQEKMKEMYGDLAETLIRGNHRADQLAKEARDNGQFKPLRFPNVLSKQECYAIVDATGKKIFSLRSYLRSRYQDKTIKAAQKLQMMPWLKQPECIDSKLSHNLFVISDPSTAHLQNFVYKMRRKLLWEKAMIIRRRTEWGTRGPQKYPNPPENGKCELCGEDENWMHPMMICPRTRFIRQRAHNNILKIFSKANLTQQEIKAIPCWWAIDILENPPLPALSATFNFDKLWGALGLIPKNLADWLTLKTKNQKLEKDSFQILADIQMEILQAMKDCWIERCKHTRWSIRPSTSSRTTNPNPG